MDNFNEDDLRAYRLTAHAYKTFDKLKARLKGLARLVSSVEANGLGMDISVYQSYADFAYARNQGVAFVWIRGAYGIAPDSKFTLHWINARGKIKRGAYLYYREYAGGPTPEQQAQKLYELCAAAGDLGELPPMLDIEMYGNTSLTANKIKTCLEKLEQLFGKRPVLYTGYYVWRDEVSGNKAFASIYPLVIAAYPLAGWQENYPTLVLNYPPSIPSPWEEFFAWQWISTAPASQFGVAGVNLDLDYASPEMASQYLGEEPPVPPTQDNFMITFKTLYNLNTRASGNYNAQITGSLPVNTVFPALDINVANSNSIWLKYAENQWVALVHNGGTYCRKEAVIPCN